MFTRVTNLPIVFPPHNASHLSHSLSKMYNRALHQEYCAFRRRPEIRAIQRPTDMRAVPKSLTRYSADRHRCAKIEYKSNCAAMEVAAAIAEGERYREFEG
jgi:hypothetical protein